MTRIAPNLSHNQRQLTYSSFFTGQLSYCPLMSTFSSRLSNHLINKLQERALRITYNDYDLSFSEFLEMCDEYTIHINNMKVLLTDKSFTPIMNDVFQKQGNYYSLRNPRSLISKRKFTTTYGINTISFRGSRIWQDLPQDIKNSNSLNLLTCYCKLFVSFVLMWVILISPVIAKFFYYLQSNEIL